MLWVMLILGEFTIHADPGTWIDYARTGKLSPNRFLLIQHQGRKGTYDGETEVMVFNEKGERLYRFPEARDAWFVRNGIMGDEDLFIFQRRTDANWYLWHAAHGARPIQGTPNLGRTGVHSIHISRQGRLYFLNRYVDAVEIEEIEFSAANTRELFGREIITFSHQSHRLGGKPEIVVWERGYLLHFPFNATGNRSSSFFRYTFDEKGQNTFMQLDLGMAFTRMHLHDGWYVLWDMAGGENFIALHNGHRAWLKVPYGETPVHRAFAALISAFERGFVHIDGPRMSYIHRGLFHELDLESFQFKTFRISDSGPRHRGLANPKIATLVEINDRHFKVSEVRPLPETDLTLTESISIPEAFRGALPPREVFQGQQNR